MKKSKSASLRIRLVAALVGTASILFFHTFGSGAVSASVLGNIAKTVGVQHPSNDAPEVKTVRGGGQKTDSAAQSTGFTPGNLVVLRVGIGSVTLSSAATPVFLDEYSPAGTLVQSVSLPTSASGSSRALTISGVASLEGLITLSADGRYIVVGGYDAAPGVATISSSASSSYARVFGRVDMFGNVDTSTVTTSFNSGGLRSVTSSDGNQFWGVGSNTGVVYNIFGGSGAGTVVASTVTNLRWISIQGGQLYSAAGSGTIRLGAVGAGVPESGGQTITSLVGMPTTSGSFDGFFFADLSASVPGVDTVYIADEAAGLTKYTLSAAGTWSSSGTVGLAADTIRSVTGTVSGSTVNLYVVSKGGTSGTGGGIINSVTDSSGYGGSFSGTLSPIVTAVANTAFRGIVLIPQPPVPVPVTSLISGPSGTVASSSATFEFSASDPNATFQCSIDGGAFASCASPKTYTGLADGSHTFIVRATNSSGTEQSPPQRSWTVDTTPPDTFISSNPSSVTNSTSASFGFFGGDTHECKLDSGTFAACSSSKQYTGLTEGSHTFSVRGIDAVGNVDPTPASYTWQIDLTPPALDAWTPLASTMSLDPRSFTVTSQESGLSVEVTYTVTSPPSFGEQSGYAQMATEACTLDTPTQHICTISGAPLGSSVSYYLTVRDPAGNSSQSPNSSAPHVYTIGAANVPGGTYTDINLGSGSAFNGDTTVTRKLTISTPVDMGVNKLTLGCSATVEGASASSYIVGRVEKQFCGAGSFTFPVGGSAAAGFASGVAASYTPVDVNITAVNGASSLTVSTTAAALTGSNAAASLARYWVVLESGDVTADMTFHYLAGDVHGTEGSYKVFKKAGTTIAYYAGGTVDTLAKTFTAPGVSEFSSWSAGVLAPTAASAEIEGRVLTSKGVALRNVKVMVSGGNLSAALYVRTNQYGVYRFEGLPTGGTYVIQVMSGRYSFANPSKVINLYESISNENFVGEPRRE